MTHPNPTKEIPMNKTISATLAALYLLSICAGVWAVDHFGIVNILGTGIFAPAAVYVVGVTLVLRDLLQDAAGKAVTVALIVAGAVLSYFINPDLAIASGVAFLVSELLDLAIYSPIRERSTTPAAGILASNAISIPVDSLIFLWLAFGSLEFFTGQVIGKLVATVFALIVLVVIALGRQRVARAA